MLYRNDPFCRFYLRGDAIADKSAGGKTITNPEALASVSVSGVPGGKGVYFPGATVNQRLAVPHTGTDFNLGKLFTIDAWITLDALAGGSGYRWVCGYEGTASTDDYWGFYIRPNGGTGAVLSLQWKRAGGTPRYRDSAGFTVTMAPTHVMAASDGTLIHLLVNGKNVGGSMPVFFDPLDFVTGTRWGLTIGAYYNGGSPLNILAGKVTGLRVSPGICRATAAGFSKPNRLA